jgi:SAM-dependent methyltransferase
MDRRRSIAITVVALFFANAPRLGAAPPTALETLRRDARSLTPLVHSEFAKHFLEATGDLPAMTPRKLYKSQDGKSYYTQRQANGLAEAARSKLLPMPIDEDFYYNTKYGSPLAYSRPLELLGEAGATAVPGLRILDFGYGTIGHLRLLASLGADAVGVDVDPMLPSLYSEPSDQGVVRGPNGRVGRVTLVHGRYPVEDHVKKSVGGGYDLILSKNTLKNGYIHPSRPAPKRMLIDLGVDDATFVKTLHDALKPGGKALIYNICPAPSPPDKPYKPWADGRCPFARSVWERAGFKVVAFDQVDDAAIREFAHALEWDHGPDGMDLKNDLFAWYTLAVRPVMDVR